MRKFGNIGQIIFFNFISFPATSQPRCPTPHVSVSSLTRTADISIHSGTFFDKLKLFFLLPLNFKTWTRSDSKIFTKQKLLSQWLKFGERAFFACAIKHLRRTMLSWHFSAYRGRSADFDLKSIFGKLVFRCLQSSILDASICIDDRFVWSLRRVFLFVT